MESEINDSLLDTLELDFCIERTIFVEIMFKILPILTWASFFRKFAFFEPEPSAVYGVRTKSGARKFEIVTRYIVVI